VYQITRNVITDYFRSKDRNATPTPVSEPVADVSSDTNLNAEVAGWLSEMVGDLPESYREALRLSELDGMQQKQVAETLSISLSGAKSRIQRGRQMLREALLNCCHIELDQRGNVIDFKQRQSCSGCCGDNSSC
jgi:RNA polymerase sigma-70 factor (ECF subfamily)